MPPYTGGEAPSSHAQHIVAASKALPPALVPPSYEPQSPGLAKYHSQLHPLPAQLVEASVYVPQRSSSSQVRTSTLIPLEPHSLMGGLIAEVQYYPAVSYFSQEYIIGQDDSVYANKEV